MAATITAHENTRIIFDFREAAKGQKYKLERYPIDSKIKLSIFNDLHLAMGLSAQVLEELLNLISVSRYLMS
jgi:hypothetical protein